MESKIKLFGHPAHPMFVVFPLGLFATAAIFDIIYLIAQAAILPTVSFYMITAGIVGGLIAALFGIIEWLGMPGGTRAKRLGGMHGLGNLLIVILFAVSWAIRNADPNHLPSTLALVLSFLGAFLALFTAWLGGEMVYRLRVGVDNGANLDASSSLSGEPAAEPSPAGRKTSRSTR